MKNIKTKWIALSFIILFLFIYSFNYLPYYNAGPRGIHQWAQADRIAICMRYIEGNSINDPATLSMKTMDGKTGVEFSGYQYIIAQIVRLGINQDYLPLLYRFLTLSIFFTALFFLFYKIMEKENLLFKGFLFIGVISSPLLLYYGYNFLPDIIALSLLLWCFYLFHSDFEKYIFIILIISGLSLFIKTSSGIYFISFMAIYFLKYWNKWNLKLVISVGLFLLIGSGVAYYDYYLVNERNIKYNSFVFLSNTIPVKSWSDFTQIIDTSQRFLGEYFNGAQQILISILGIIGVFRIKKLNRKNKYTQLAILIFLGLLSIILLFGVQFMNHDYYIIGTFMPILLLFIIKGLSYVSERIQPRTGLAMAAVFALISFSMGNKRYFNRMSETVWIDGNVEQYAQRWLEDADKKIEPYVPDSSQVFAVYTPEPNFALVYLKRKGATFNTEEMGRVIKNPFIYYLKMLETEYVVCRNNRLSDLKKDQPLFIKNTEIVFSDSQFTLYKFNGY